MRCLLLIACLIAGCKQAPPAPPPPPDKVHVTATVYPLAMIAREVGGPLVDCDWLVEQGQSVGGGDPSVAAQERITRAELILGNGAGEEWATIGYDDPRRGTRITRLDTLPSASNVAGPSQFWLDPEIAKEAASAIAEKLRLQRPQQGDVLMGNAKAFSARVDQLLSDLAPAIASCDQKKVLVLSRDYTALTARLGMTELNPVSVSPMRVSDDQLATLRAAVRADSPIALLVEVNTPPSVQRDLAARIGVPVVALDSLGSSTSAGRNSYLAILKYNIEQLASAASGSIRQ